MEIKIKCPDCGKEIRVRLHVVEELMKEISDLKAKIKEIKGVADASNIFSNIFK